MFNLLQNAATTWKVSWS